MLWGLLKSKYVIAITQIKNENKQILSITQTESENKLILVGTVSHNKGCARQLYTGIHVQVVHNATGYTIYL